MVRKQRLPCCLYFNYSYLYSRLMINQNPSLHFDQKKVEIFFRKVTFLFENLTEKSFRFSFGAFFQVFDATNANLCSAPAVRSVSSVITSRKSWSTSRTSSRSPTTTSRSIKNSTITTQDLRYSNIHSYILYKKTYFMNGGFIQS